MPSAKFSSTMIFQTIFIAVLPVSSAAFTTKHLQPRSMFDRCHQRRYKYIQHHSLHSSIPNNDYEEGSDDDQKEPIFYDDFEDFDYGTTNGETSSLSSSSTKTPISSSFPSPPSSEILDKPLSSKEEVPSPINKQLSSLLTQAKQEEIEKDERLERNWSTGNWKVRGFSIAQYDNQETSEGDIIENGGGAAAAAAAAGDGAIKVCQIAFDETMLGFDDVTETIAVGRTDGSVYVIQLGSDYMTNFAPVSNDNASEGDMENVSSAATSSPFEILHQFYTDDKKQPIESLLYHDELLYTSSGTSGEIKVWSIDDDDTKSENRNDTAGMTSMIPIQTLCNGHSDKVVVMKTLSTHSAGDSSTSNDELIGVNDHNLLLTASLDGSFALWSRDDGDLVYRCEMTDDSGNPVSITCADVDTSSKEHFVYLGLSSGYIVGYAISDLVGSASAGNECPVPSCRFMAHDPRQQKVEDDFSSTSSKGVTAIACVGKGDSGPTSMMANNKSQTSSVVLTGGADGVVKQYQIIRRQIMMAAPMTTSSQKQEESPSWKLEHWPRLPTQRMKNHAHIFQGHYDSVSALASLNDSSKIISASIDGTLRIWDQSKGEELYRMDGFDNRISSLCLDREVLVTNGMNGYVCVHDFDVTDSDIDEGFDFDMEW